MNFNLENEFENIFKTKSQKKFFSPGRVNLIGEHIDYNGGFVFPCNLDMGTYALVSENNDNKLNFFSTNFKEIGLVSVSINDLNFKKENEFVNYLTGIFYFMEKDYGVTYNKGLNILICGNIPPASGLSSSASIEVLTAVIIKSFYNVDITPTEMVLLCQKSENQYNKVNCGIMDQFVIGICKKDNAILLDTNTLKYEDIPLELGKYKIVICNSKVKRGLADSKYNERRSECENALMLFNKYTNSTYEYLCDIPLNKFLETKELFLKETNGEIYYRRAHHAITENQRTILAKEKLIANDFIEFGKLLDLSHLSLKDDYKVSCNELDILVTLSKENGAIGSRMTGAGFGGCTVSIVHEDLIDSFITNVSNAYREKTGINGEIYIGSSGDYAKEIGGK